MGSCRWRNRDFPYHGEENNVSSFCPRWPLVDHYLAALPVMATNPRIGQADTWSVVPPKTDLRTEAVVIGVQRTRIGTDDDGEN